MCIFWYFVILYIIQGTVLNENVNVQIAKKFNCCITNEFDITMYKSRCT